jgi:hypothetical protein
VAGSGQTLPEFDLEIGVCPALGSCSGFDLHMVCQRVLENDRISADEERAAKTTVGPGI